MNTSICRAILIIFITSILINGISSSCVFGFFSGTNPDCTFYCNFDSFISVYNLSFTEIKIQCDNVRIASLAYPNDCNSLDDLLWRNDSCSCPYCPCTQQQDESVLSELLYYNDDTSHMHPVKECVSCKCSSPSSSNYGGIDGFIYECDTEMIVDDFLGWDDYICPPDTCKDDNNNTKQVGDYWWEDVEDYNTLCQQFCYCSGTDGKICAYGYENIMENDKLKWAFMKDCRNDVEAVECFHFLHKLSSDFV